MGSTAFNVGFEPIHRPAVDIPPFPDAVCRLREGSGKWGQKTLAHNKITGEDQSPEFKFRFVFFPFKCCVSHLSVDRFGKNFEGVMTLGQVKSSPNFCSFGPQRAEKRNI